MNVLSLFDGISCARVALERLGCKPTYYASEVDKYAIQIAQKNYPDTIHLGDVRSVKADSLPQIDLLIGGSPCQDLSLAKANRKGLDRERSGLFWEYVRILHEVKPRYFVLENVNSMPKEAKRIITEAMGVEPIMIDAALVSAQRRKRLFWTNIPEVTLPADRGILLKDILEPNIFVCEDDKWVCWLLSESGQKRLAKGFIAINPDKAITLKCRDYANWSGNYVAYPVRIGHMNGGGQGDRVYSTCGKTTSLSANGGGRGAVTGLYLMEIRNKTWLIRKLTPIECERLQSLPDNYTEGISNTQRYKCLGNAFNVEVVKHILSFMDKGDWND